MTRAPAAREAASKMTAESAPTGLAPNPEEYRRRLQEQDDAQLDAWAQDLMRDLSIRIGVRHVLDGFMKAARVDERGLERVFTAGGGPIATMGRTADGRVMMPAVQLFFLVRGIRATSPDARDRLIDYLVSGFHELAFI